MKVEAKANTCLDSENVSQGMTGTDMSPINMYEGESTSIDIL